jgi:oligopeptide transport system substrate-binding protein
MRHRPSRPPSAPWLVALALALAACGGAPPPSSAPVSPTPPPAAASPATPTAAPATVVPAAATATATQPAPAALDPNAELRLALGLLEPPTLDPHRATVRVDIVATLWDTLFVFDEQNELAPLAAREVPTRQNGGIAADGLTYTVRLRPELAFSDGTPATAEHYVYSVRRLLHPRTAAPAATFYYDLQGAKVLHTAGTAAAALTPLVEGLGVTAADAHTLVFRLDRPRAAFLQLLALWVLVPLKAELVERGGEGWADVGTLVGTGPFVLTQWQRRHQLVLEPNPHYWGKRPQVKRLIYKLIDDSSLAWYTYQAGGLDLLDVPPAFVQEVLTTPALAAQLRRPPALSSFAILFNVAKPPLDNADVRRAIATALDREGYRAAHGPGVGTPAYSWIPPGMPGHQPELGRQYRYDPARARAYLRQAGVPDPQLTLTYFETRRGRRDAEFVQESLRQALGLAVRLEPLEVEAYDEAVARGDYQLALGFGIADIPDPDSWLPATFGSGARFNFTRYANPAFDQLVARAQQEPDATKRLALWGQAQALVVDEAAMAFVAFRDRFVVVKPHVKGVRLTPIDWMRFIDDVRIERRPDAAG